MFDLAQHYGQGPIALKDIAERQEISEHYLEQLVAILRKNGLVKSVRGAQGGYLLARPPQEITVGEILRVLEGPIGPTDCVADDAGEAGCSRMDACVSRLVWQKIRESINSVIDSITLEDMCRDAEMIRQNFYMNHI